MPEIRYDATTDELVIIAPERNRRPHNTKLNNGNNDICPFCVGNEHLTTKEIYISSDNINMFEGSYWSVRVIPNKYPALVNDFENTGFGVHEVIIDTPSHDIALHQFDISQLIEVLNVIKNRVVEIEKDHKIKYVQVFKNVGVQAGASQSHSHWQIIGMPVIASKQKNKTDEYCAHCANLDLELMSKERIIEQNNFFTAYTPYASILPYQICIMPNEHIGNITLMNSIQISCLANILKSMLIRLNNLIPNIAYNICFLGSTNNEYGRAHNHWHLQILPRISNFAGFEFATGCYINEILPEIAAKLLKRC